MSGGVDSSVTAALLVQQGYDVHGVSLRMWEGEHGPRVCSDHRGAEEVAEHLADPHTLLDLRGQFADIVVKPFAQDYVHGRTPNPCVACNRDFKFGTLLRWTEEQGAEFVATGHYANGFAAGFAERMDAAARRRSAQGSVVFFVRVVAGTIVAHAVSAAVACTRPLCARKRARSDCRRRSDWRVRISVSAITKLWSPPTLAADELGGGDVVDGAGKVLGQHGGVHTVTVGQRRGLGISGAEPLYVVDIDQASKRVVVGNKNDLNCAGLIARSVNWIEGPMDGASAAEVQIRYRAPAVPCVIRPMADGGCEVRFDNPLPAVTPGQAAVFYRGEQVLGGGWIERALR